MLQHKQPPRPSPPCPPGVCLSWLGFSAEGLLVAGDSRGTLRVRSPQWGGSWLPVWDGPAASAVGARHVCFFFLDVAFLTFSRGLLATWRFGRAST